MLSKEVVRLSIFVKRNPNISDDEFHKHWVEDHIPLVGEWLTRNGILRYVQHHITPDMRKTTASTILRYMENHMTADTNEAELQAQMLMPYDGVVELWMHNLDDYFKARKDPLYKEKVEPDISYMADWTQMKMSVGKDVVVIEDGKILPDSVLQTRTLARL